MTGEEKNPKGFAQARRTASGFLNDKDKTAYLLREAISKAERSQEALRKGWTDLQALLRLVHCWAKGKYSAIPLQSILLVITAIVYFVNPFDVVPDFFPVSGFLDDATILAFVLRAVRQDLDQFLAWESKTENHETESDKKH